MLITSQSLIQNNRKMESIKAVTSQIRKNVARKSTSNRPLNVSENSIYDDINNADLLHSKRLEQLTKACLSSNGYSVSTNKCNITVKNTYAKESVSSHQVPEISKSKYYINEHFETTKDTNYQLPLEESDEENEEIDGVFSVSDLLLPFYQESNYSPPYFDDSSDESLDTTRILNYPIETDFPLIEINKTLYYNQDSKLCPSPDVSDTENIEKVKCNFNNKLSKIGAKKNANDKKVANKKKVPVKKQTNTSSKLSANEKGSAPVNYVEYDVPEGDKSLIFVRPEHQSDKDPNDDDSNHFIDDSCSDSLIPKIICAVSITSEQEFEDFSFSLTEENELVLKGSDQVVVKQSEQIVLKESEEQVVPKESEQPIPQPSEQVIAKDVEEPIAGEIKQKIPKKPAARLKRKSSNTSVPGVSVRKRTRSSVKGNISVNNETKSGEEICSSQEFVVNLEDSLKNDIQADTSKTSKQSSTINPKEEPKDIDENTPAELPMIDKCKIKLEPIQIAQQIHEEEQLKLCDLEKDIDEIDINNELTETLQSTYNSSTINKENIDNEEMSCDKKKASEKKSSGLADKNRKKEINEGVLLHVEAAKKTDIMQDGKILKDKKELLKDIESKIEKNLPVEVKDFDIQQSLTEEILLDQALRLAHQRTSPRRRPLLTKSEMKAVLNHLCGENQPKAKKTPERRSSRGKANKEENLKNEADISDSQVSDSSPKQDIELKPSKPSNKPVENNSNAVKQQTKKQTKKGGKSTKKRNSTSKPASTKNQNSTEDLETLKTDNNSQDEQCSDNDADNNNEPKNNNNSGPTSRPNTVKNKKKSKKNRKPSIDDEQAHPVVDLDENTNSSETSDNKIKKKSKKTRKSSIDDEQTHPVVDLDENKNSSEPSDNKNKKKSKKNRKSSIDDEQANPVVDLDENKNSSESSDNQNKNQEFNSCDETSLNSNSVGEQGENENKRIPVIIIKNKRAAFTNKRVTRRQAQSLFSIIQKSELQEANEDKNVQDVEIQKETIASDNEVSETAETNKNEEAVTKSPIKTSAKTADGNIDTGKSSEPCDSEEYLNKSKQVIDSTDSECIVLENEAGVNSVEKEIKNSASKVSESSSNECVENNAKPPYSDDIIEITDMDVDNNDSPTTGMDSAGQSIPFLDGSESTDNISNKQTCSDVSVMAIIENSEEKQRAFITSEPSFVTSTVQTATESTNPPVTSSDTLTNNSSMLSSLPGFPLIPLSSHVNITSALANTTSSSPQSNALQNSIPYANFNGYSPYSNALPNVPTPGNVAQLSPHINSNAVHSTLYQTSYQIHMSTNSVTSLTLSNFNGTQIQNAIQSPTHLPAYSSQFATAYTQPMVTSSVAASGQTATGFPSAPIQNSSVTTSLCSQEIGDKSLIPSVTVAQERNTSSQVMSKSEASTTEQNNNTNSTENKPSTTVIPLSILARDPRLRSRSVRVIIDSRNFEVISTAEKRDNKVLVEPQNSSDKNNARIENAKLSDEEATESTEHHEKINSNPEDSNEDDHNVESDATEISRKRFKKKEVDEELVYKTPLSDLHDAPERTSYSRTISRRSRPDGRRDPRNSWRRENNYQASPEQHDHHEPYRERESYREHEAHREHEPYQEHQRYQEHVPDEYEHRDYNLHDSRTRPEGYAEEYNHRHDDVKTVPRRSEYYKRRPEDLEGKRSREYSERRPLLEHPPDFRRSNYRPRDNYADSHQRSQDYRRQNYSEYRRKNSEDLAYPRWDYAHKKVDGVFPSDASGSGKVSKGEGRPEHWEDENEVRDLIDGPMASSSAPFFRRRRSSAPWKSSHLRDDESSSSPYNGDLFERRRDSESRHIVDSTKDRRTWDRKVDDELINGPVSRWEDKKYSRGRERSPRRDYEMYEKKRSRREWNRSHGRSSSPTSESLLTESPMSPDPENVAYADPPKYLPIPQ